MINVRKAVMKNIKIANPINDIRLYCRPYRTLYHLFTISVQTADRVKEEERTTALRTAKLVAETPSVTQALQTRKGLKELRDYTLDVQHTTGTEFVVVMDMNSIRLTHPDANKIGKKFTGGDEQPAMHGHIKTSTSAGTLGKSMRAFVPIYGKDKNKWASFRSEFRLTKYRMSSATV